MKSLLLSLLLTLSASVGYGQCFHPPFMSPAVFAGYPTYQPYYGPVYVPYYVPVYQQTQWPIWTVTPYPSWRNP